jgi:phosphatidate cytidylyltransferase
MTGLGCALIPGVFTRTENIEKIIGRITAGFSVFVYPGFFLFWLSKMTVWKNAGFIIVFFLLLTLCNDSAAWLAGSLFGKNNSGVIHVSPNKSIAGFTGGAIGSILIAIIASLAFPEIFIARIGSIPVVFSMILLGFCTGIAAALGDLAESAIKRSCGVKDSGSLMPGRGGILDSIDSIAVAAPVFFLLYNVFFVSF